MEDSILDFDYIFLIMRDRRISFSDIAFYLDTTKEKIVECMKIENQKNITLCELQKLADVLCVPLRQLIKHTSF